MSKSKKIKDGFVVIPYAYFRLPMLEYSDVVILGFANGYQRAGKPFINYFKTLQNILDFPYEEVENRVNRMVDIGYLIPKKSDGPVIEYELREDLMDV